MADFAYTYGLAAIMEGSVDWEDDTIKVALIMTNTTADTENDKTFMDQFTTLDEFDGAGYSRQTIAITQSEDTTNDRAEANADANTTFSSIGAGTRNVQAMVVYKHVTNDSDSIPLLFIDSPAAFPYTADGNDLVIVWDTDGICQIKTGS
jgi:hypothetical protein